MSRQPHEDVECPEVARHWVMPAGYVSWHEWAEHMNRTYRQKRCPGCGLLTIWVKRRNEPSEQRWTVDTEVMVRRACRGDPTMARRVLRVLFEAGLLIDERAQPPIWEGYPDESTEEQA